MVCITPLCFKMNIFSDFIHLLLLIIFSVVWKDNVHARAWGEGEGRKERREGEGEVLGTLIGFEMSNFTS